MTPSQKYEQRKSRNKRLKAYGLKNLLKVIGTMKHKQYWVNYNINLN